MVYTDGDKCFGTNLHRSTGVHLKCAAHHELLEVVEKEVCAFMFIFVLFDIMTFAYLIRFALMKWSSVHLLLVHNSWNTWHSRSWKDYKYLDFQAKLVKESCVNSLNSCCN